MQAQGSALQDELAEWLRGRGFAAERGRKKMLEADDWKSPEILGAKKDREAAERLINKVLVDAEKDRESASEKLREASLVFERAQDREDRWRKKVEAVETMHIEAAESRRNAQYQLAQAQAANAEAQKDRDAAILARENGRRDGLATGLLAASSDLTKAKAATDEHEAAVKAREKAEKDRDAAALARQAAAAAATEISQLKQAADIERL